MRLTVIGCSGSYPGPDSPASCYLLEADHEGRTYRLNSDRVAVSVAVLVAWTVEDRHADLGECLPILRRVFLEPDWPCPSTLP